jgi:hypothetical protein
MAPAQWDRKHSTFALCSLQCKEVALIHSEGILAGEMKHGPLALVDEHLPIVVVATRDSMYHKMESVIQQLLARNAKLVIVCTAGDENMKQYVEGHDCKLIEVRQGLNRTCGSLNLLPWRHRYGCHTVWVGSAVWFWLNINTQLTCIIAQAGIVLLLCCLDSAD